MVTVRRLGLLLPVLACTGDVDLAADTPGNCSVTTGELSSTEARDRARCLFSRTDEIEVFSYTSSVVQDVSTANGRFDGWQFLIRREREFYVVDIFSGGGDRGAPIELADAAQCGEPLQVIDSVKAIEAALEVLGDIDPPAEHDEIGLAHVAPCVNLAYPPSAAVLLSTTFQGPGYRYVLFDDSGAVVKVCSSKACEEGLAASCCDY